MAFAITNGMSLGTAGHMGRQRMPLTAPIMTGLMSHHRIQHMTPITGEAGGQRRHATGIVAIKAGLL
jgi:hypothetical protein